MEFFLGFCFISAMIGFFITLGSRKRYVRKCAKLQQENDILKQQINNLRSSVDATNVLRGEVQTMPTAGTASQAYRSATEATVANPSVTAPVEKMTVDAPVQTAPAQVAATPVAPVQPVQPVQPMQTAQPVAPVQTQQQVPAQPVQTVQPVAPQEMPRPAVAAKPQAPKKEKSKLSVVGLSFGAGVLLLIIAAAVFITATWNLLPPFIKIPTLFTVVAAVFGISMLCTKKFKIEKTGSALYILGSCLMPLAIFGTALAFGAYNGLLILILCALSLMITGYLGYRIFKSDFQIGVSIFGLVWVIIFIAMEILGVMEGFFVGFAIVTAIFTGICKFFPNIKSFSIASQIVAFASLIVWIICGIGMFAATEFETISAFASSFAIITASGYLFRRNIFHFASSMAGIAAFIVFASYRITGNSTGTIFGFALATLIYIVIAKLLPRLKEFDIASEIISYVGIILYIVAAYIISGKISTAMLVLNVISLFILTAAIMLLGFKRKIFNYVSPFFCAATLPVLENVFRFHTDNKVGLVILIVVFAYIYIAVYSYVMKKINVANWLSCAVITVASGVAGFLIDDTVLMRQYDYTNLLEVLAVSIPFVAGALSYVVRRTIVERILYSLVMGVTFDLALAMATDSNIAYIYIMMGVAVAVCAVAVITKKIPFIYEGYVPVTFIATMVTAFSELYIHKCIAVTVLLAALAVVVICNYKKGTGRNVVAAFISAIAVAVSWGIIGSAIADDGIAFAVVLGITFVIYLVTILGIRFKNIENVASETFKNLMVIELAIACFMFAENVNEVMTLILVGVVAITTLLEVRNYANVVPVIVATVALFEVINVVNLPIAAAFPIVLATILVYTIIGRIVNRRVFSAKMGIDWFTVFAPFTTAVLIGFEDCGFFILLALAFYAMTFVGRFRKDSEDLKSGIKNNIKIFASIAIMFVGFAFMSASFITYPEMFSVELHLAYIIVAAAIVRFVIRLPKVGRWIWFLAVAFAIHVEAFAAIVDGTNSQLSIMAVIGIGLFVISFIIKNKTWFILAIETIGGIGVYLAISYWDSALWWVYLLVAGLLLIGTATFSEVKRRKVNSIPASEGEVVPKKGRFQEWKW